MATVDMRNTDQSTFGSGVGFSSELYSSPISYVWSGQPIFGSNIVYLYGTGIASSSGQPTAGTIDEIRIDLSGDGFFGGSDVDITITGISLPLVDLAQDSDLFWEAVLQNNDTIHMFNGDSNIFNHSIMFGDGLAYAGSAGTIMSNDTLDATGTPGDVSMYGDYSSVVDASITAGDDVLTCDDATAGVSAVGDIANLWAIASDVLIIAGDDTIDITCTDLVGGVEYLVGDVMAVIAAADPTYGIVVEGGDDTITNQSAGPSIYQIAGDVFALQGAGGASTINGGSDGISGSSADEDIAGDVYDMSSGFVAGGNDFILAGGGDDDIAGDVLFHTGGTFTGGADIIDGGLGNDTIDGQGSTDTALFGEDSGVVVVLAEDGLDGSAIGQGNDVLRNIENVIGSEADDAITGNSEGNFVQAFDGNDSVRGLGGDDVLAGLGGNDTLSGGSGDDVLDGGSETDWIDFSAYGSGVIGDLAGGLFTAASTDVTYAIENVIGSRHADDLGGDEFANSIRGGRGADILRGREGNDVLTGGAGDDTVHGGNGDDTVKGGDDDDVLNGQNHDDLIQGGLGEDTLDGGAGSDWASYAAAANAVTVDLSLGTAQDTGEGLDTLILIENLTGSGFDDILLGDNADNQFIGGVGADTITGSLGADVFVYESAFDTGFTVPNRDVIEDFAHLVDQIDVDVIDAQTGTNGNQDFDFIGTDEFSAEGQIRVFQSGADTQVRINATGVDEYETAITLKNTTATDFTVDDFLL